MGKTWRTIEPGVWKPEQPGDHITGVLVNKEAAKENVGAKYYIENENGLMFLWGSAILDDRMQHVKVGSEVRITYQGQDTNKKNQKVNLYKVEVAERDEDDSKAETTDKPQETIPEETV